MKLIFLNIQGELGNLARGEVVVVVLGAAILLRRQFCQLGRQDEEEAEEERAATPFFEWGRGGRGKSQV